MEVHVSCPLGAKCEEIKDNKIHRCAWYQKLVGTDAQGNDRDEHACAMAWMPILMVEQVRGLSGVQSATEAHRNEMSTGMRHLANSMPERPTLHIIEGEK